MKSHVNTCNVLLNSGSKNQHFLSDDLEIYTFTSQKVKICSTV